MFTLICWSVLQSAPAYLFFKSSTQLFLPAAEVYLLETAINRALLPLRSTKEQLFALFNTMHCRLCQGTNFFAVIKMVFLPSAPGCFLRSINPSVAEQQTDPSLQSQTALQTRQQSGSSNMSVLKGVSCVKHTDNSTTTVHMQACNASIGMSYI